jgi:hypothetical protein
MFPPMFGHVSLTVTLYFGQEEEEESFVLSALCNAAEEGNVTGLEELLNKADKVNINQKNRVRYTF